MKKAFTLIELLVVIAIIAILAAILFPVFTAAKEKARQTACLNNMKQLAIGFMSYRDDWSGCFPGCGSSSYTNGPPSLDTSNYWRADWIDLQAPAKHFQGQV